MVEYNFTFIDFLSVYVSIGKEMVGLYDCGSKISGKFFMIILFEVIIAVQNIRFMRLMLNCIK